jgi:hypothetical protein
MPRQEFAGLLDAMQDAVGELGFAEVPGHGLREFLPKRIAALFVDARITEDGELVCQGARKINTPFCSRVFSMPRRTNAF